MPWTEPGEVPGGDQTWVCHLKSGKQCCTKPPSRSGSLSNPACFPPREIYLQKQPVVKWEWLTRAWKSWSRYVGWTWFFGSMFVPQVGAAIHLRVSRNLVINLTQASGKSSTEKQYSSAWQQGLKYYDKHGILGYSLSLNTVLDYLASIYKYRIIKVHRSACLLL